MRVHESGTPFTDPSGDRLRDWMGVDAATFYDRSRVAILPMAFCFPGYDARRLRTCRHRVSAPKPGGSAPCSASGTFRLTLLIGDLCAGLAPGRQESVTERVAAWRDHAPGIIPLPHPSWRNTAWLKRNPWFEAELLPVLRARVREVLE
jgi:uracil-DNA glycosylase